jgi:hypothetical protein
MDRFHFVWAGKGSDPETLVSPYSYGYRGLGGDGPSMLPSESVRLHGKLCLVEDDTRTHVDLEDVHHGRPPPGSRLGDEQQIGSYFSCR